MLPRQTWRMDWSCGPREVWSAVWLGGQGPVPARAASLHGAPGSGQRRRSRLRLCHAVMLGRGGLVEQGGEAVGRGVEIQRGSRAAVEGVLDAFEIGLGVAGQVGAFLEPEPQQPVGVFVGAALPR